MPAAAMREVLQSSRRPPIRRLEACVGQLQPLPLNSSLLATISKTPLGQRVQVLVQLLVSRTQGIGISSASSLRQRALPVEALCLVANTRRENEAQSTFMTAAGGEADAFELTKASRRDSIVSESLRTPFRLSQSFFFPFHLHLATSGLQTCQGAQTLGPLAQIQKRLQHLLFQPNRHRSCPPAISVTRTVRWSSVLLHSIFRGTTEPAHTVWTCLTQPGKPAGRSPATSNTARETTKIAAKSILMTRTLWHG